MSTVRVYKSTDPGAPAHPSATRGSMAALLRACLVTGYGSGEDFKAPAGWEEPFAETNNCAVFRALAGAKQFFQIDDNQASANVTMMYGYESMSSATVGAGNWGSRLFGKTSTAAGSSEWVVVADQKTCYVFLDTTRGLSAQGFGEYRDYQADSPYNSFIAGHSNPAGLYTTTSTNAAGTSLILGMSHKVTDLITTSSTWSYIPAHNRILGVLSPNGLTLSQYMANNGGYYTQSNIDYTVIPIQLVRGDIGSICGKYRGLWIPMSFRPKTHKEIFVFNGRTFLALNIGYSTTNFAQGQLWIDITDSWDEF